MMTTLIWGHGARTRGEEKVLVPAGTTIRWFSQVDENLLTNNGFLALETGDFGNATDTQGPGDGRTVEVYNYQVYEDLVKRDWVSMLHRGDSRLMFVGAEVTEGFLCSSPATCRQAGQHNCAGVFGRVQDSEIVILVCRGVPGSGRGSTAAYGSDVDAPQRDTVSDMAGFVTEFMKRVRSDPDAAMTEFAELSDPVKIHLAPWPSIAGFQAVHWAAYYAASAAPEDAFRQLAEAAANGTTWGEAAQLINDVDTYRARFADGAAASPAAFFAALDAAPAQVQAAIGGIGRVQDVRTTWQEQSAADSDWRDEAAATWVPNEAELAAVAEINQAAIKATDDGESVAYEVAGFVLLVGAGHGAEWYSWAQQQPDHAAGTITVTKGGVFSSGRLEVDSCPPAKQGVVESALGAFSDKDVKFV
jgi:hypothetical protein